MIEKPPAVFSPCRKYRYQLWRQIDCFSDRYVMFIGLNPSTADETADDPTIRRCIAFAKRWGYSWLCMTNIFAWRDTDPAGMKKEADPIGPENNANLEQCGREADQIIAAWGIHGTHRDRGREVAAMFPWIGMECLGVTKDGHPKHPLYLKSDTKPVILP